MLLPPGLRPLAGRAVAWVCLCFAWLCQPGCGDHFDQLDLDLDRINQYSSRPLSDVLGAAVTAGYLEYPLIDHKYERALDHFLLLAAKEGPTSKPDAFPFTSHRSAYYLNVYHALVIRCWLDHGGREQDPKTLTLDPAWHDAKAYTIDAQTVSINDIKTLALATGDARLALLLNDGTCTGPALSNSAYAADTDAFDQDVDRHLLRVFSTPNLFTNDASGILVAPHWLAHAVGSDASPALGAILERYVLNSEPNKLSFLRAVKHGNVTFREQDMRINHPANR